MFRITKLGLSLSNDILDTKNKIYTENGILVPILAVSEYLNEFDELYSDMGQNIGFLYDACQPRLFLEIEKDDCNNILFSIRADFTEFSLENDADLETYSNWIKITLSDNEMKSIEPTLKMLFEAI